MLDPIVNALVRLAAIRRTSLAASLGTLFAPPILPKANRLGYYDNKMAN